MRIKCGCSHQFTLLVTFSSLRQETQDLEEVAQGPLAWNPFSLPELVTGTDTQEVLNHGQMLRSLSRKCPREDMSHHRHEGAQKWT